MNLTMSHTDQLHVAPSTGQRMRIYTVKVKIICPLYEIKQNPSLFQGSDHYQKCLHYEYF